MYSDRKEWLTFTESIQYKLAETARISELLGRNYYKNYVKGVKSILELDEFKILSHILKNPDASQSDIAKLVYKGKAHVGKILNEMENKGYITRDLTTRNNMMVKCTVVTEKGKELYFETDKAFKKLSDEIFSAFSDEESQYFVFLLDKLKNKILEKNEINF